MKQLFTVTLISSVQRISCLMYRMVFYRLQSSSTQHVSISQLREMGHPLSSLEKRLSVSRITTNVSRKTFQTCRYPHDVFLYLFLALSVIDFIWSVRKFIKNFMLRVGLAVFKTSTLVFLRKYPIPFEHGRFLMGTFNLLSYLTFR